VHYKSSEFGEFLGGSAAHQTLRRQVLSTDSTILCALSGHYVIAQGDKRVHMLAVHNSQADTVCGGASAYGKITEGRTPLLWRRIIYTDHDGNPNTKGPAIPQNTKERLLAYVSCVEGFVLR